MFSSLMGAILTSKCRPRCTRASCHEFCTTGQGFTVPELTDALELHVIELPKLGRQTDEPQLARWVRFFLAQSEAELQELAMSDVDMQRAKDENINPADGTTFWHGGPCPALIRSVDLRSAGSTRALSGMTAHEQRVPSCPIAISRGALRPKGARGADRVR